MRIEQVGYEQLKTLDRKRKKKKLEEQVDKEIEEILKPTIKQEKLF